MQINGPAHLHGPQAVNPPHRPAQAQPAQGANSAQEVDQLEISQEADLVSRVKDVPDVRADRVAQIKAEIAAGTYETDEKLDLALERLLDEIG